jgi:hypothetical protein
VKAAARTARRTIRTRSAATRLTASLNRGRSIATHVLAAGVDAEAVAGVVNGLRSVAKRLHVEPVKVTRTPRTIRGRDGHGHRCGHYTAAQIQLLVSASSPARRATSPPPTSSPPRRSLP